VMSQSQRKMLNSSQQQQDTNERKQTAVYPSFTIVLYW
jgi:hypothetical protein